MGNRYPSVVRRYSATFIDAGFLLITVLMIAEVFQGEEHYMATVRLAVILGFVFCYEPLATSFFCTVGQFVTGIRVRLVQTYDKPSVLIAYIRLSIKFLLGWYSFFSILFSAKKRALHDLASGTVVVYATYADTPPLASEAGIDLEEEQEYPS